MAQLTFMHICHDAFLTDGTKALNIIGIFDQLHATQFPVLVPKFSVVAHCHALDGSHELALTIKREGNTLAVVSSTFLGANHQWISHFAGMTFSEPGEYVFEIAVDGELTGTKRLFVIKEN